MVKLLAVNVQGTFLVKDAAGIIANVFGPDSWVIPKNRVDQFVFVSQDDAADKNIGIGMDAVAGTGEPNPLGGSVKVGDLADVVAPADKIQNVAVSEIGDFTQIEIAGNYRTTDVVVFETDLIA